MRTNLLPSLVAATILIPKLALADDAQDCPPGAWFCNETPAQSADSPPELPPPTPATPPPEATAAPVVVVPGARQGSGPVVVYQQSQPPPVVVARVPVPPPPPPPEKRPRRRRWGFNLRLLGIMMDDQANQDAGMGGLGFSFRMRPERHIAIDLGLDLVGGHDYEGHSRGEIPFTVNALVYANPRNPVQFYMLGGLGWSHASVDLNTSEGDQQSYNYFGAQLGAGLEIRLSPPVSLNFDLVGFIRGRTDRDSRQHPEFYDPQTGQTTNTSGGGMARGGVTFYW